MFARLATNQDALLVAADAAMYQAKEAGRNTICFVTG